MPEAKKIFISHIADESADAARAKEVLEKSFGTRVELFLASSWESIPPGEDWYKNNAASIIAIILVATLCYVVAFREKYEYANGLLNIVFVVIGYYFGSKREKGSDQDDED